VEKYIRQNGQVVAEFQYDGFGNTIAEDFASTVTAHDFVYRFSSKYWDEEVGFYYYGYRYYSPKLGRWIKRDPLLETGGRNTVKYIDNNSINSADPLGLSKVSLHYDFADTPWWERISLPIGTKWVKKMSEVEADLAKIKPYNPQGKSPCMCVKHITLTDHSGNPGLLSFGDGMIANNLIEQAQRAHKKTGRFLGQEKERRFLGVVGSKLCNDAVVDFVQCQSGKGPEGTELRRYLSAILPESTVIKLYDENVKFIWGTPKCVSKKIKK